MARRRWPDWRRDPKIRSDRSAAAWDRRGNGCPLRTAHKSASLHPRDHAAHRFARRRPPGGASASLEQRGVPALQDTHRELGATTLGAWMARVFAVKHGLDEERGSELVSAFAGDVFSVHHDPETDEVVAAWRVRLFGQNDSDLWSAVTSSGFVLFKEQDGRELGLIASEGRDASSTTSWRLRVEPQDWLIAARSAGRQPAALQRSSPAWLR